MAKPYSIKEQMAIDYFKPDKMITVLFAEENFDRVVRKDNQRPYYTNLKTCKSDCKVMKKTLEKYRISDNDIQFDLTHSPTLAEVKKVFEEIKTLLVNGADEKPKVNFLVFLLFAGHGILKDGMQTLVLNEFDDKSFYNLFKAEHEVRSLS